MSEPTPTPPTASLSASSFGHLPAAEKARRLAAVKQALARGDRAATLKAAEQAIDGLVLDRERFLLRVGTLVDGGDADRALVYVRDMGLEAWTARARLYTVIGALVGITVAAATVVLLVDVLAR